MCGFPLGVDTQSPAQDPDHGQYEKGDWEEDDEKEGHKTTQ
jgi:hypothetical protein